MTSSEIKQILSSSTIQDNRLYLNCGQLSKKDYKQLDDLLCKLGGSWNSNKKCHIFSDSPTDLVEKLLAIDLNVNNDLAYFNTPAELLDGIVYEISKKCPLFNTNNAIKNGHLSKDIMDRVFHILEPSAGTGHIVDRIKKETSEISEYVNIDCCELDELNRLILERKGHKVVGSDFLTFDTDKRYDIIVMNPPFSVLGKPDCYIDHIKHAFKFLSQRGILVAILNTGWETKPQKKFQEFREWLSDKLVTYIKNPKKSFDKTTIPTVTIVLDNEGGLSQPYNGYLSYNLFNFILVIENEGSLHKDFIDLKISANDLEERCRKYLYDNDMFFSLSKPDVEEFGKYRKRVVEEI